MIGWAGVDGIHYCFVHGFGEMVFFVVSPMNTPGNYVHPMARDFRDFLRLLMACGDTAALEQVYCWDLAQFDALLRDNPLTAEQQAVLDAIREKLLLAPLEQPFAYIKELQAEFDYSRVNGTVLSGSHGCGASWNPCFLEGNGLEAKSVPQHYGLDPAYGWAIRRADFHWMKKRKKIEACYREPSYV